MTFPADILHVLVTFARSEVRYLLMGGQACIHYGAAEFSKDIDLAVLCDDTNLAVLKATLNQLQAKQIAVPPFEKTYLDNGQAIHFRCDAGAAAGMRIDLMSRMRGVPPFDEIWSRRTTALLPGGEEIQVMSLRDLIRAKKTQRNKDWPMISRLMEVHYLNTRHEATVRHREFWFRELRTATLLIDLASQYPEEAARESIQRPAIAVAMNPAMNVDAVEHALGEEEETERIADRIYWEPLKKQLEQLRHRQHD
jgi:hypothetical protein